MAFFGGGASAGIGGSTGATDNAILRADGTGAATLQNSDLNIDDATTTTQNNVAITNQHSGQTNSALVLTPKGTGAFIVGPKPDGTSTGGNARGANAICVGPRTSANQVAAGDSNIRIGNQARSNGNNSIAIGTISIADQNDSIAIGGAAQSMAGQAIVVGHNSNANSIAQYGLALGKDITISNVSATGVGYQANASLRSQFATRPFLSVYWSGTTTNNTATVLNLDGTATNRFTIAANTAAMVDLNIIARRTDTVDKWFSSRRMVAIRRNNANGTAIIGSVQTIGTDQTEGSPTWSVAITADDTNEALQVEVTGAAGETVSWRVMAFYQVV